MPTYPENISPYLSIDETALSKGELYTIITNKRAKAKKGSLVATFCRTKVEAIAEKLLTISSKISKKLREITLDLASSMKNIVNTSFPSAIQVTDGFPVQKLAIEALKDIRIQEHCKALDNEIQAIKEAKKTNIP